MAHRGGGGGGGGDGVGAVRAAQPSAHAHAPPAQTAVALHAARLPGGPAIARAPRGAPADVGTTGPHGRGSAQSGPAHPCAQMHTSLRQMPWLAHSAGQRAPAPSPLRAPPGPDGSGSIDVSGTGSSPRKVCGRAQSSPEYPGAHAHLPS